MQIIRISPKTHITHACGVTSKRYLRLENFDDFKFGNCDFLKKRSVMSRRKQRSAFDQVSEFDRGRIVAYRDCGLPFSVCAYHSTPFTAELSVRKTSIVWSTLDAEPQTWMWVAEWNEVVFTDQSRICLQLHDGRIRVWRHRGDRMLNSCVMHRHTGLAPGIMVWGGIRYHSRTPLLRIPGLATAIFQQDNARPQVARIVQRFFVNHQIDLLPWPARSSDLSPIENMWSMVAQRLTQITPLAATPDQLWQRVEVAWSAVPQERNQSLIESMPRRVAAVISNNGVTLATDFGRSHTSQKFINLII
ncbi:transposable element Tc1 transposase [Trichonephila clavipes]|nr:transposable element Tc1 transposase [Trichonephila clavipes]